MTAGPHTVSMFAIALITAQQMTRRAVNGAHRDDAVEAHANGDFRKVPPKPGVRTSRIGPNGDVRST
jgi:hypothetical protein